MAAKYIMGYISRESGGGPKVQVRPDEQLDVFSDWVGHIEM